MRKLNLTFLVFMLTMIPLIFIACDNDVLNIEPLALNHYTMTFNRGAPIDVYISDSEFKNIVLCNDPMSLDFDFRISKYEIYYERKSGVAPPDIAHRVDWLFPGDKSASFCFSVLTHEAMQLEYNWQDGEILTVFIRFSGVEIESGNPILLKGVALLRAHTTNDYST